MKTYLPAFLTNPISANTCWQMSQQKHSGCQLLFIALITRPIMNSPVRKTIPGFTIPCNYIIILSSYTAHLPPNLVGYIIFSIAVLVLNSGIWVGFVCLFFAVGQKQMSLLMDNLLFFIYKPFSTFSLQLSLSSPICFFLSDLKLLQNIQSSFYNMSVLFPYHLCLSPLLEEGNFNLSFTQ